MTITLPPEVEQFLTAEVEAGRFASVDAAVEASVLRLMHEREFGPLDEATLDAIDAAEAEHEAGLSRPWAEVRAELEREWLKPS